MKPCREDEEVERINNKTEKKDGVCVCGRTLPSYTNQCAEPRRGEARTSDASVRHGELLSTRKWQNKTHTQQVAQLYEAGLVSQSSPVGNGEDQ